MQKRSVVAVLLLPFVTFGIYALVWLVKTKREMVREGADIPTSWLIIVPIVSIYWQWKWCGGVEHFTRGRMSQAVAFLLMFFLGMIGAAIIQDSFNKEIDARMMPTQLPQARIA